LGLKTKERPKLLWDTLLGKRRGGGGEKEPFMLYLMARDPESCDWRAVTGFKSEGLFVGGTLTIRV